MEVLIGCIIGGVIGYFLGREIEEGVVMRWIRNTMRHYNYSDERQEIINELMIDMYQMHKDLKKGKDTFWEHQKKKK